ncbi:MAG: hypothetical protein V1800_00185 [Candidatus Latescibacterota bacterium]
MKFLALDSRWIAQTRGVRLSLGSVTKEDRNPLFVADKPWEMRFDNLYPNVRFDENELFKVWYSPFVLDEAVAHTLPERRREVRYHATPGREMGVCYATSRDGIHWGKPELGLVEFEGSTRNNLVKRQAHGAGIGKDLHDPDPARRYKMLSLIDESTNLEGVAFSPDGLHWSDPVPCPEIQARGDTHHSFFWDQGLGRYIGFTRTWESPHRIVARTESEDFLQWSQTVEVMRALPDAPHLQPYSLVAFPHAPGYLGLVMIFNAHEDTVDCELAWSADAVKWERICPGETLIPRGPEGTFDCGCLFGAAHPIRKNNELWLYYGGSDGPHSNWRRGGFGLARLREDGFAGMEPVRKDGIGTLATRPIVCGGRDLRVTADAAGGTLRVGILGAEGYGLDECLPIRGDVTRARVTWRGVGLASLGDRPLQLQFELRSAKLYAIEI